MTKQKHLFPIGEGLMLESLQHVIDSSAANIEEQREAVLDVLKGIGVPKAKLESCMVEAWNKVPP
jgi:50S ribosomal subunit-associated GTPase HflX